MSNLAYQSEPKINERKRIIIRKKKSRAFKLTPGEKTIILLLSVCFAATSIMILHNQASIYETNKEIQVLEANIEKQLKTNSGLEEEIALLRNPERILSKARELGLTINENNIKLIHQ